MFFAKGETEKLPEELQKKLNKLDIRYQLICYLNDENKNINRKIIDYIIDSLELSLKYYDKIRTDIRDLITGAVGNIPLTLDLDNIKLPRKIKDILHPLIDIIDYQSNLHIDRKRLIVDVLKNLQKLKKDFKDREFPKIKIAPPFFSEKKYPEPSSSLKKKFEKCEEDFYNFLKSCKDEKNIDKKVINLYSNLLELYLETKHPYFLEFINKLPVILIGMKIKLDERIEDIIFDQIYLHELRNRKEFINQKLKKLEELRVKS